MTTKTHPRTGLLIRDNNDDGMVANEVKAYEALNVEGQPVLDVGSHVGFSMHYFLERGAAWVIGFEPDPETYDILRQNMERYENGYVNQVAVVGNDDPIATFYRKKNYRNGTLHKPVMGGFEEFTVPAVNFRKILAEYPVSVIKVDVEGGEYTYDFDDLPSNVKQIAMEFHLGRKAFKEAAPVLLQKLLDQGFRLVKEPDFSVMYCSVAVMVRE